MQRTGTCQTCGDNTYDCCGNPTVCCACPTVTAQPVSPICTHCEASLATPGCHFSDGQPLCWGCLDMIEQVRWEEFSRQRDAEREAEQMADAIDQLAVYDDLAFDSDDEQADFSAMIAGMDEPTKIVRVAELDAAVQRWAGLRLAAGG